MDEMTKADEVRNARIKDRTELKEMINEFESIAFERGWDRGAIWKENILASNTRQT